MTETHVKNPYRIFLLVIGATFLFSIMNLGVKYAGESGLHVTQIMLFRSLLALPVVLFLITRYIDSQKLLSTKHPFKHVSRGLVGMAGMACFFISFEMLPLGDATALHFASPLIMTVLAIPILREKVGPWRWGAVIIGLVGVVIVANPTGNANVVGSLIAVMAAALGALAGILVRKMGDTEHSLTIVFYFTLIGVVISAILCPFFWQPINSVWVFYALLLAGTSGGFAQYLLTMAYAEAPAAYVSVFTYISIVLAIFYDLIFWGHIPPVNMIIGSVIIISGGLIILYREVVHKGREAKLSVYTIMPVRPTKADKKDALHPLDKSND